MNTDTQTPPDAKPSRWRMLVSILTPAERRRGLLILFMMVGLAFLDTIGVASVLPFLAVLGNPEMVHSNAALNWLYVNGGFTDTDRFLFALGLGSFLLLTLSATFRIFATYASTRYVQMRRYSLSQRLLTSYLRQPYTFFLNRNSSSMSKGVLSEVDMVITQVMTPLMNLVTYLLLAVVIVVLLVAVDPWLALLISFTVGGMYAAVYLAIHRRLRRMGKLRVVANEKRFKAAAEAFGGIKDLKVLGRESAYLRMFAKPAHEFSRLQYIQATLQLVPKYLVEAIAFGGMLAMALVLMARSDSLGEVLPMLGLYAFGGYRLLPAAQNVYGALNTLRFGWPALETLHADLVTVDSQSAFDATATPPAMSVNDDIRFRHVDFVYPGSSKAALCGIDLAIPARSSVAFVGPTGAGKTTIIDLLLGLLRPSAGHIEIDGQVLDDAHIRAWQQSIGYVPQSIYLADQTVSANIAFGIPPEKIDQQAVERAARIANIDQFIRSELPDGYATEVGERGIRLSGGQRQRIGIARALYHDPSVLVLDEATSALDTETERAIMDAVNHLSGQKTIVMIAHRISTVRRCDQIVVLESGQIKATGSHEELQRSSVVFQRLSAI
ncbi:MAG: ABC transporter ATP-binding protein/permease [Xanthomonadales bacterium]|nr:ABC transporter ATP-binding protein/permease [Xanthomonadales bacterium]